MLIMLQLEAQATSQVLRHHKEALHTAMFQDIHLVTVWATQMGKTSLELTVPVVIVRTIVMVTVLEQAVKLQLKIIRPPYRLMSYTAINQIGLAAIVLDIKTENSTQEPPVLLVIVQIFVRDGMPELGVLSIVTNQDGLHATV